MAANSLSEGKQQELLLKERKANSAWRKLCRNKSAVLGLIMISFVLLVSIFGPLLMSRDPAAMDFLKINAKPGTEGFLLGSDNLGRDMLTRLVYGGRVSLLVAVGGMAVGAVIGILIGLVSGYAGGGVDAVLMRIMDGMSAFPFVLLALIGGNMIKESRDQACSCDASLRVLDMLGLAVATSIDALAVGVTFAFLEVPILPAVSLIGATTFLLSVLGALLGRMFGLRYKSRAELLGGAVLILMGLNILLEHLGLRPW